MKLQAMRRRAGVFSMECPKCGSELDRHPQEMGVVHICENCGWGRDPAAVRRTADGAPVDSRHISTATWVKLPIFWALTLLICLGPYVAIVYGLPYLAEQQEISWASLNSADLQAKINPMYWIVLVLYLGFASIVSGGVDFSNLGMGGTLIDNPFTLQDDFNRVALQLALIAIPGKIVILTVLGTFRVFGMMVRGQA